MKNITSQLLDFLKSRAPSYRADLVQIVLPNGNQINVTNGQLDITYGGTTYYASAFGGWQRGAVTSVAGFSLEEDAMELTVTAPVTAYWPGTSTPFMSLITSGLFDGAKISMSTVYMPFNEYGNVVGSLGTWGGIIVGVQQIGRSLCEFSAKSWMTLLNLKVPWRVIQPSCFHTLFDAGCALTASDFALANTVGSGSTQEKIVPASNWPATDGLGNSTASPYFVQGKIVFTSGQNAGLAGYVVSQGSGAASALYLQAAMPLPIAVGDAFNAYPGCDKTITTCTNKFQNQVHNGGLLYVPPPETTANA